MSGIKAMVHCSCNSSMEWSVASHQGDCEDMRGHGHVRTCSTNLAHPRQCLLDRNNDGVIVELPKGILRVPQHVNYLEGLPLLRFGSGGCPFQLLRGDGNAGGSKASTARSWTGQGRGDEHLGCHRGDLLSLVRVHPSPRLSTLRRLPSIPSEARSK